MLKGRRLVTSGKSSYVHTYIRTYVHKHKHTYKQHKHLRMGNPIGCRGVNKRQALHVNPKP